MSRWFHAGRYDRECAAFDAAHPIATTCNDGIEVRITTFGPRRARYHFARITVDDIEALLSAPDAFEAVTEFQGWTVDGWIEGDPIALYSPQPRPAPRILSWRWMVDEECCCGSGIVHVAAPGTEDDYIPDMQETYCTCEAGKWRVVRDGTRDLPGFGDA